MEDKNLGVPIQPTVNTESTLSPTTPIPTPNADVMAGEANGVSKKLIIIGVLLLLILAAVLYWFMSSSTPQPAPQTVPPTTSSTSTDELNELKAELDSVVADDAALQQDITALDKDLAELQ